MMEFEGEFTCDGTPDDLWKYFTDPDILQDCAPGCEEMTLVSPSQLTATLSVGVGSVKPTFDVDAVVVECDRPERLEVRASGSASRNSFEVSARQELADNGDGTTTVRWTATAEVSGIIASMGERALGSVAKKLVDDFFRDLEAHANAGTPAESQFEAASEEELAAAGYGPEVEPATDATGGGSRAGTPGTGWSGVDPSLVPTDRRVLALAVGAVGTVGFLLWRRSRSGTAADRQDQEDVREQGPARERGGRLRHFVLGVAVGVAGKLLWDLSRGSDSGGVEWAGETGDELGADTAAEPGAEAGATLGETSDSERRREFFEEDPLDRLESRYAD